MYACWLRGLCDSVVGHIQKAETQKADVRETDQPKDRIHKTPKTKFHLN